MPRVGEAPHLATSIPGVEGTVHDPLQVLAAKPFPLWVPGWFPPPHPAHLNCKPDAQWESASTFGCPRPPGSSLGGEHSL